MVYGMVWLQGTDVRNIMHSQEIRLRAPQHVMTILRSIVDIIGEGTIRPFDEHEKNLQFDSE